MPTMQETADRILSPTKGVLVADEYAESLDPRRVGDVPSLVDLALRSDRITDYVSAMLLTEPTFAAYERGTSPSVVGVRQPPPPAGSPSPRESVERLARAGAAFAEWRANRRPPDVRRGDAHIDARALARGASAAQAAGVLPVISIATPDIGDDTMAVSEAVTTNALLVLRRQLADLGVAPRELLLRINAVAPGTAHPVQADPERIARATLRVLERCVPDGVPGILILSGGRSLRQACEHLAAITSLARERSAPWRITFGFSRPLFAGSVRTTQGAGSPDAVEQLLTSCRLASEALGAVAPGGAR